MKIFPLLRYYVTHRKQGNKIPSQSLLSQSPFISRSMSIVRTKRVFANMSQIYQSNASLSPSSSKCFIVTKVNENGEISVKKNRQFFYLIQLSSDLKFSKNLKDRKSSKFIGSAFNIESEVRLIFNAQCKVVDFKDQGFLKKKTKILLTLSTENPLSEKIARGKLKSFSESEEGKNCPFKFHGLKFEEVSREIFEHYNRYGRRICEECGEFKEGD